MGKNLKKKKKRSDILNVLLKMQNKKYLSSLCTQTSALCCNDIFKGIILC